MKCFWLLSHNQCTYHLLPEVRCWVPLGSFDSLLSEQEPNWSGSNPRCYFQSWYPRTSANEHGLKMPIIPFSCLFHNCALYSWEEVVRILFIPWKTGLESESVYLIFKEKFLPQLPPFFTWHDIEAQNPHTRINVNLYVNFQIPDCQNCKGTKNK